MDIFEKAIMVARIASQRKIISISAPPELCRPKKIIDQSVFKISWQRNIPRAILTSLRSSPFFQTRNAAIPISAKSVVQTGPNIHDGGLRSGFASVVYQLATDGVVNTEPIMPANSEIAMATMSLRV